MEDPSAEPRFQHIGSAVLRDHRSVRERVEQQLLDLARSGELDVTSRLPGERELATMLGVSRTTLRQALNSLEQANVVTRRRGRSGGTFLLQLPTEGEDRQYSGLASWLRAEGRENGTKLLSARIEMAGSRAARALRMLEDEYVFSIVRLRFVDGTQISLEHARVPVEAFPDLLEQRLGDSIGEIMFSRYGRRPSRALEWHQAAVATAEQAALLDVDQGAPLLRIDRVTFDQDDRPIEFGEDVFLGDCALVIARVPVTEDTSTYDAPSEARRVVQLRSI